MDHNVLEHFWPGEQATCVKAKTSEDYNIFNQLDSWTRGPHSLTGANPAFVNPGADDYRLSGPVNAGGATYNAGITWRPQDQQYGP